MKTNISAAIEKLIAYNQRFVHADFSLIHMWITEGCDLEKDILPALQTMMARNKNITTLNYFAPLVHKNRDNRLDIERCRSSGVVVKDSISEEQLERNKAFKRKMGMYVQ